MPHGSAPDDPLPPAQPAGRRLLGAVILSCAVAAGLLLLLAAGLLLKGQAIQFFRHLQDAAIVENEESPSSLEPAALSKVMPAHLVRSLGAAKPPTSAQTAPEAPHSRPLLKPVSPGSNPAGPGLRSRLSGLSRSRPRTRSFLRKPSDASPSPQRTLSQISRFRASPVQAAAQDQSACFLRVDPLPGVKVSTRYLYYAVRGATPEELSDQIKRFGPFNKWLGRNSIGKAECDVRSPYQFMRSAGGQCRLSFFSVNVAATITLPRWDGRGPPDVRARWEAAMRNVRAHEESHRAIAIHSANAIYQALADFQPMSCDDFENSLKAMLESYYAETERNQSRFDKAVYANPDCQPNL